MGREWGSGWGDILYTWLIHVDVWLKQPQYCEEIILQLNKLIKKKNLPFNSLPYPGSLGGYCLSLSP